MGIDDAAWDHSEFSKNRDRLLADDIETKFLTAVFAPKVKKLPWPEFVERPHRITLGADCNAEARSMG